jgi:hypothetical protein
LSKYKKTHSGVITNQIRKALNIVQSEINQAKIEPVNEYGVAIKKINTQLIKEEMAKILVEPTINKAK